MPLYEYECEACARRFERIQKFSDPPVEVCPFCGAGVRKLLSSPAIHFKGTGWYVTDYAQKGKGESAGSDASKDSSSAETAKVAGTTAGSGASESGGASGSEKSPSKESTAPSTPKSDSSGTSSKQ